MNPLHMVSEAVLLEGSWCALEQAGRLLNAAVGVHDRGDAGTALALALFGREEVGRSRILRALAGEVARGATLDATGVAKRCRDHSTKQREGASGTTIRIPAQSGLSQAVQTRGSGAYGSPEWQTADDAIKDAVARKAKRDPQDWHALRERALYVDLSWNATGWSRPSTIHAADAREHIDDAADADASSANMAFDGANWLTIA